MTTEQTIRKIFTDKFDISDYELTGETTNNDMGMDSLDKVEVVMELEKEFGISIDDDTEFDPLKQLSDYVKLVEGKINNGNI